MPKGYPVLNHHQKQEIITRVKENGEKVADLSREFGVIPKTIYNLLGNQINQPNILLELSKLKREKEALISIIGELVAEQKIKSKSIKKVDLSTMILTINSDLAKQNKSSSKTLLANDLGVSRQLLYYEHKLPKKDLLLVQEIKKVMAKHKSYGYRKVIISPKY